MKKSAILILLFCSQMLCSQNDRTDNFWSHVRFGGGFGLGFGSNYTTIAVSPSAIYQFNQSFALGIGTSYLYAKNNDLRSNVYGAGLIALYDPIQNIQFSAEFEQLFVNQSIRGFEDYNFNYPALYFGLAYRSGWFSAGLRYDVLYNENKSIYASPFSPIFRFYF